MKYWLELVLVMYLAFSLAGCATGPSSGKYIEDPSYYDWHKYDWYLNEKQS